jgi:hypothetical protein
VSSSVPTKLQKHLNTATPSSFVCKRLATSKNIVSLPNFTMSHTYEYAMAFCGFVCLKMLTDVNHAISLPLSL